MKSSDDHASANGGHQRGTPQVGIARRRFLAGAASAAALSALPGIGPFASVPAGASQRIIEENQKTGSTGYRLESPTNDDEVLSGYALQDSATVGQIIEVCVLSNQSTDVSAEVYRLGWYGGEGGRLMQTIGAVRVATTQRATTREDTGETDLGLAPSFRFAIPSDWLSGLYVIRLRNGDGVDAHVTFAVKDDRQAAVVFAQPILTYAAYAATPGPNGKSLYDHNSGGSMTSRSTVRATEISLDRPYRANGSGDLFVFEHHLVMWVEQQGYDITYVTNLDVDRSPATLLRGTVAVISGHDEYWTQRIMDAYLAARDAGVSIANLGANNGYWRVRLASSRDGRARRRVICFKYADGENSDTPTVLFKDTDTPMQSLFGVDFMDFFSDTESGPYAPIVPVETGHWFWAGTDALRDQELQGANIMGYEVDRRNFSLELPANTEYTLLASSPFEGETSGRNWCHSVIYRATSGAWVFSSGTTSWGWGLNKVGFAHPGIARATQNLFDRLTGDAGSAHTLTIASANSIDEILAASDYQSADAMVLRLYRAFFDREPDLGGAKFWLQAFRDGWTLDRIATFFSTSDEFVRTYGQLDDDGFIDVIYANVLDRSPDIGGRAFWLDQLRDGMQRSRLVLLFSDSPEFIGTHPYAPSL